MITGTDIDSGCTGESSSGTGRDICTTGTDMTGGNGIQNSDNNVLLESQIYSDIAKYSEISSYY